jgi:MFS family permease
LKWQPAPKRPNEQEAIIMEEAQTFIQSRRQIAVSTTLILAMLLASLGASIVNVALPTLANALSASFADAQTVVSAYLITLTATVVISGRLGDRFGSRRMLLLGLAVYFAGSLGGGVAPDLPWLIAARALQGTGGAFLMTLSLALARQTAKETQIGRMMGLMGTASAVGTVIGPSLGGLLLPAFGWRAVFWAQAPLAAVAFGFAFLALPKEAQKVKVVAATPRLALSTGLAINLLANLLVAAVMMTTLVVGPFYLRLALGLQERMTGLIMAIGPVISIFSGIPSGRLVDAHGSHRVLGFGLSLMAVGSLLLALLPNMIGALGYVMAILVLTPGYQLFQAANNTAAMADARADQRGAVSGLLSLSRNLGLLGGASIMGMVFTLGVGTSDLAHVAPASIADGIRVTFLLATGMVAVALTAQQLLRRAGQDKS